jgi:hypothetical protein
MVMEEVGDTLIQIVGIITLQRVNIPRENMAKTRVKVKVEEKAIRESMVKEKAKVKRSLPKGSTLIKNAIIVA